MSDPDLHDLSVDSETTATAALETRRTLLRRSVAGLAAFGLAGILAACGDDEEPVESGDGGAEDPGEEPGLEEETGIGDDDESPVSEETEEAEGD